MELADTYRQIEARLDQLDFAALHRGFSRFPFSLYRDNQAFFQGEYMDRPENFLGNTSVQYNGADTAIWELTDSAADLDVLTSKIVHEMLHAYQHASGESRWANEREALVKYRYDEKNLSARLAEAELMQKCLSGDDPDAFSALLSLRKARMTHFPYAYDYEARIEQIEGTAQFVELSALNQLNPEKAEKRWAETISQLRSPAWYFPARAITYTSGAAFLACLKKYTDFDTDAFTDTPFSVAAIEKAAVCPLPDCDGQIEACLADWKKRLQATVEKALEKNEIVLQGENRMVGWNVYDASWDGTYAVLTAFLAYIEGMDMPANDEEVYARMKVLQGDFVAAMDAEYRLSCVWRQ